MKDNIGIIGLWKFIVMKPDRTIVSITSAKNTLTYAGISALCQAWVWSGIEDVATSLGIYEPYYLAPIYGAIGIGTPIPTPTSTDTQLQEEVARVQPSVGASLPASNVTNGEAIWEFFFGSSVFSSSLVSGGITEAGVYIQASTAYGTLLNHVVVPSTPIVIPNGYLLQLQMALALSPT